MEKRKRWQFWLIIAVLALTVYNILPTLFYYSKPLSQPIGERQAGQVAEAIASRVDDLQGGAVAWTGALAKHLHLKPTSITPVEGDDGLIAVTFPNSEQASTFAAVVPKAGELIPFVPAQLSLSSGERAEPNTVYVQRKVDVAVDPAETFLFTKKRTDDGAVADLYATIVYDRAAEVATTLGGTTEQARLVKAAPMMGGRSQDAPYLSLAQQIVEYDSLFGSNSPITRRFYAGFSQIDGAEPISALIARLESAKQHTASELRSLQSERSTAAEQQMVASLTKQSSTLDRALAILRAEGSLFRAGEAPLTESAVLAGLDRSQLTDPSIVQRINIGDRNPFFNSVEIDWQGGELTLLLHPDVEQMLADTEGEEASYIADKLSQLVINEVAYLSRKTGEEPSPVGDQYQIALDTLNNSQSVLVMKLGAIAKAEAANVEYKLAHEWAPESVDLSIENYPVVDYATFEQSGDRLGFVVYAPAASDLPAPAGFRPGSLYVIARGMGSILERAQQAGESDEVRTLANDLENLQSLMQSEGFFAYAGSAYGMPAAFQNDIIFEMDDFYSNLLGATREDFVVHGTKRFATLDFSDVEQRIRTTNQIETAEHEDLLRWRDEYRSAQVSLQSGDQLFVPKPTKNAVLSNWMLSAKKYFRGDDRKILKWGLDLSGGKRVTIGLRDQNGRPVTDESDQRVAVNELYERVNKMGVSEVEIRIEGPNIVLNFPGAQNWSASELIKASTMTFHIVNEKFASNPAVAREVDQFLQEVWNEAVVTNRKDIASINEIAWRNLGEDIGDEASPRPRSSSARTLLENGLRLAGPNSTRSTTFDDSLSTIAMWREQDLAEQRSGHPLMIVFNNYALEGSSLRNVQAQYDSSKGNVLLFDVASSNVLADGMAYSPRSDFYLWTSQVAEEQIAGTPRASYTGGRGWRMAVILNDQIISSPALHDALRDHAMISGSFSQREANQLASDLKAGSLSFTPQILSEQNISPDLGLAERHQAMMAAAIGFVLLFALMIGYYRFAGVVASCAVIINLLIMWGILQNLEAALTLPGIAGVILAVGMSVDANVLVFERIREEFAQSGRLASAVHAGYRKAFSAIFDSNITTIIAAMILMHFDSGPIKGFALTLIVGIVSSMFTALFMTRYYFAGYVQKHQKLTMANLFGKTKIDFLSKAKVATLCSALLIAVGLFVAAGESKTILGMDFTGGYALTVELQEQQGDQNYRAETMAALEEGGATAGEVQIRELGRPSQLRIQLGAGMEEQGHPFYGLPIETPSVSPFEYEYLSNPRIVWVVDTLSAAGLELRPDSLARLQDQWTAMSGQFSDAMRNAALFGLGLALLCILAYITVRFEFKYAVSAIIALAHDVLITVGAIAILHKLGVPVQIDLQAVGALMTIVGYSLNDTIIIFDRIREDSQLFRKMTFPEMINRALNVTLNRTLMTSGTTLLVLLALVALGGSVIFGFALVMTMGVLFGTFSSLFIASPALLYFHRREEAKSKRRGDLKKA